MIFLKVFDWNVWTVLISDDFVRTPCMHIADPDRLEKELVHEKFPSILMSLDVNKQHVPVI